MLPGLSQDKARGARSSPSVSHCLLLSRRRACNLARERARAQKKKKKKNCNLITAATIKPETAGMLYIDAAGTISKIQPVK